VGREVLASVVEAEGLADSEVQDVLVKTGEEEVLG
jgi:hypothetical protein